MLVRDCRPRPLPGSQPSYTIFPGRKCYIVQGTFWLSWQPPHDEVQGGNVGTDGGDHLRLALQGVVDLHLGRGGEEKGRGGGSMKRPDATVITVTD